ncbi:MAG: TatD family hydrolase [Corynebacterium sp.]|nr:TatD family hydrolase [Corynebacterium sp.]
MLRDTHYHFEFLARDAQREFVETSQELGFRTVAQTLTPSGYRDQTADPVPGVEYALGFHPWFITSRDQAEAELAVFDEVLAAGGTVATGGVRLIGEIGLDFQERNLERAPEDLQREVFGHILGAVARAAGIADAAAVPQAAGTAPGAPDAAEPALATGAPGVEDLPFVLSIHGVRAFTPVLDMLEESGLLTAASGKTSSGKTSSGRAASGKTSTRTNPQRVVPIIHWFMGTSDELTRLMRGGGCISFNTMMLKGKKGRAYAKQVPAERILLETDLPAGRSAHEKTGRDHAADQQRNLTHVLDVVSEARGITREELVEIIRANEQRLYR